MKVQNISGELIILAGVKLQPQEICSVNDFDGRFFIPMFKEEFIVGLDNHTLQFLNEIGEIITDVNEILSYSENPIQSNSITLNPGNEDFYYNYKSFDMEYNDVKNFKFEGFLKTLDIFSKTGDIEVQIIEPKMNKIQVQETSNYTVDCDYKLKDPTIRITCKRKSEVALYMDGSYYNTTKTKEQYLNEIYSDSEFPETSVINNNDLAFKVNFKKPMKSSTFVDSIGNYLGETFNGATLLNFNKFEDGSYVKFNDINKFSGNFTFNLWFNMISDISSKQTFYSKEGTLDITLDSSVLNITLGDKLVQLNGIKSDNWSMLTITKNEDWYSFYLNDQLIKTLNLDVNFSTKFTYVYFGCKYPNIQSIRSGELGECLIYNYHFSNGMVKYLYMNNHPKFQIQTNLIKGCYLSRYFNSSSLIPETSSDFSIIEKENTRVSKLITTEVTQEIKSSNNPGELSIFTGKIYIPSDNKYTFNYSGGNGSILLIDDKAVLINEGSNTIYMEEGYYRFKFTVVGNGNFELVYGIKGNTLTKVDVFIEDFDDTEGDDYSILFDLDNRQTSYGLEFSDFTDLKFKEEDYITVSNIPESFNNSIFNIAFNLNFKEKYAVIFGQGLPQEPNFGLRVNNGKLVLNYQGTTLTSNTLMVNKMYHIQITSNGTNIYLYIDSVLVNSSVINKISRLNSTNPLYFGRVGVDYMAAWGGEFEINNFKWYLKYFTEDEIINNFIKNKA